MREQSFDQLMESVKLDGEIDSCEGEGLPEGWALTDELDHQILMHRDAHFSGDFQAMIDYYEEEGIGTQPDFDLDRIHYLKRVEEEMDQNLAALMLTAAQMERVSKARAGYAQLKALYQKEDDTLAHLIADLILSEEEEPSALIEQILALGERIVPDLIQLVKTPSAYDTLSPGYGLAPALAIHCLGEIGAKSAITPIFERFGSELAFDEEILLTALYKIGEQAQLFLLDVLKSRPITADNIHAAFALTPFSEKSAVAVAAFQELQSEEVRQKPLLSTYLLCHCDALCETPYKKDFIAMAHDRDLSPAMRLEIESIVKAWA